MVPTSPHSSAVPATKNRHASPIALAITLCVFSSACVVGPDYVVPTTDLPDAWQTGSGEAVEVRDWWSTIGDAKLTELIERSQAKNLDVRAALARIEEAQAVFRITDGRRSPSLDATGGYSRSESSEAFQGFPSSSQSSFDVGLSSSWEIDLFGHVRRSIEAAGANYEMVLESSRGVLISLHSDVAQAYIDIRLNQQRIAIALTNVSNQKKSLQYVTKRHDSGVASGLDLAQAQSNVASTEALIPQLEHSLTRSIHRLAVLLNEPYPDLRSELEAHTEPWLPSPPQRITSGLPADLLRRRPDVREAERALAAETATVGIEKADLYPRLNLAASLGLQSGKLDELFDSDARRWSIGPSVLWNLFDGDRARGDVEAQEARVRQALARYEQTILLALEEVESTLSAHMREGERVEALTRAVDAYRRSSSLSEELYLSGQTNFQNVLDAQRNLLDFEDQLAVSQANVLLDVIALYLALGGSWEPTEPQPQQKKDQ